MTATEEESDGMTDNISTLSNPFPPVNKDSVLKCTVPGLFPGAPFSERPRFPGEAGPDLQMSANRDPIFPLTLYQAPFSSCNPPPSSIGSISRENRTLRVSPSLSVELIDSDDDDVDSDQML